MLDHARLYGVTPDEEPERVVFLVAALLRGGVEVVQLRHKGLARARLLQLATQLREMVRAAGALFIVNDHLDIALMCRADGVHLGEDDLPVAEARRLLGPGLIIGASASTPAAARGAVAAGADYIGAGPAFSTPVKAGKAVIGPGGVRAVADEVGVPVFAIGGINEANVLELVAAGVNRACVIHALAADPEPEAAARRLREALGR